MDVEQATTDAVVAKISKEDGVRYRALIIKPFDSLADEDREFLKNAEVSVLNKHLALKTLGKEEVEGCTCNAGMAEHRSWCPHYGQPSAASQFMQAFRKT